MIMNASQKKEREYFYALPYILILQPISFREDAAVILYKQNYDPLTLAMDLEGSSLKKDLEKTRIALDVAYSGFNNCTDFDLIDSYDYEISALQRRYHYLTSLLEEARPVASQKKRHFILPPSLFRRKRSHH